MIKNIIQGALRTMGVQLTDYPKKSEQRQLKIIETQNIDIILDIGANTGQYGTHMRKMGYTKKIVSFEPMKGAFRELEKKASKDKNWTAEHYALGNEDGTSVINISGNSYSSSILEMLPSHEESAPSSKYVAQEEIEIKKLDTIFDTICGPNSNVMLKVDTQGFEKSVLDGALAVLPRVRVIELEMSLVPLYESNTLYLELIHFLEEKGFELHGIDHVFSNASTGQLLQVDGTFVRKSM